MALLVLDAVIAAYRDAGVEVRVLDGADLSLEPGDVTSLVGRSGSGKSTLLGVIAGLMRADSGSICFDGDDVATFDEARWAHWRATRLGTVVQGANLVPFLTARENVELAAQFAGGTHRTDRAIAVLDELGVAHRRDHLPRQLSGGEAQRVAVATALVNEPALLLADEVTGELDSASASEVLGVIVAVARARGLAVLFVTHDGELAARADRRLRLVDGRLVDDQ